MLQGRFRWKPILIMCVGFVALAGGWFMLHRFQTRSMHVRFLDQAARAEESSPPQYDRAARFLRIYLLVKGDDVNALERYGVLLDEKVPTTAKSQVLGVYERVLELDKERDASRLSAAKISMQLGKIDKAVAHLTLLEARPTVEPEVFLLLGDCKAAKGYLLKKQDTREAKLEAPKYWKEAEKYYRESIVRLPKKLEGYTRLAQVLRSEQKKPLAAERVLEDLVKANASDFRVFLIRASFRQSGGDGFLDPQPVAAMLLGSAAGMQPIVPTLVVLNSRLERDMYGASDDLARARQLAPDQVEVLLGSSIQELLLARGKGPDDPHLKKSKDYLESALSHYPSDTRVLPQLATVELAAGRRTKAIEHLRKAQKQAPDKKTRNALLWDLAGLLIDDGVLAEAKDVIDEMRKSDKEPHYLEFMRAKVAVKQSEWNEAINKLETARPLLFLDSPAMALQADLLMGLCFEQVGNIDQQLSVYQRAQKLDRFNPAPRIGVARSLAVLGRLNEAADESRTIPGGDLLYARLLILKNFQLAPSQVADWGYVTKLLGAILEKNPSAAVEIAILQAEVAFAEGIAAETQASILDADARIAEAKVKSAEAKMKFTAADDILSKAKLKHPDNIDPWIASSFLAGRKRDPNSIAQALKILVDTQAKFPDKPQWRLAMLRFLPAKKEDALAFLRPLTESLDSFERTDRALLHKGLAEAHEKAGNFAEAEKYWEKLAQLEPNRLGVFLLTFDFYLRTENQEGMKKSLKSIVDIEGRDGPLGHFGEAQRLIYEAAKRVKKLPKDNKTLTAEEKTQVKDAGVELFAASAKRPHWSRIAIGLATVAELEGNTELAIKHMRDAVALGNRQLPLLKALVSNLIEKHQYTEADEVLRKIQEVDLTSDNYLQMRAAEVSLFNQNIDRALELTRRAVAGESKDFQDHLWQGQMLAALGRRADAEKSLKKATELSGDNPAPWVVLVQLHARSGDAEGPSKAGKIIDDMKRQVSPSQAQFALAQCYQAIGKQKEAEEAFLKSLAEKKQAHDIEASKVILQSVVRFYQSTGKPKEAELYCRQILEPEMKASSELKNWGRRNLALALSFQDDAEKYQQGLKLLEENKPASVEDNLTKGLLLATRKDRHTEAIKTLETAFKARQPSAEQQFILASLYEGQEKGWEKKCRSYMIALLAAHQTDEKYQVYLAAFIDKLIAHKEIGVAKDWLGQLQETVKSNRADPKRLATGISLLTELSRRPELFEKITDKNEVRELQPQGKKLTDKNGQLAWAGFLGSCGHTEEALKICKTILPQLPPGPVIAVAVAAVSAVKATPQQFGETQALIETAKKKAPGLIDWDLQLAILKERQERYKESEALYRSALAGAPHNIIALNNLAFLLGLQGNSPEANKMIKDAIDKVGEVGELLDTRAAIYRVQRKLDEAEKDIRRALGETETPYRLFHLAEIQLARGNAADAAKIFTRARDRGLREEMVHPLEIKSFRDLGGLRKPS